MPQVTERAARLKPRMSSNRESVNGIEIHIAQEVGLTTHPTAKKELFTKARRKSVKNLGRFDEAQNQTRMRADRLATNRPVHSKYKYLQVSAFF
ncbi:hypothetical protein NPIL_123861 [Nephila pilipes]|uniref:Uncharacterized protein n=1 Tax=Nephila pilipes TaxID=299642 RepID=A0A8X6NCK8_NEPPI|nr:hypothetical protein NPIL_123861 [Nephila pilipes]